MASFLLVLIYIAFISLGLPDSVLGAAWPSMYGELGASIGSAGIITMIMYSGTAISSITSGYVTRKIGTAWTVLGSVCLTAVSLWGFSISTRFIHLCLFAIPYGFGGGGIDACLNNYVTLHYKARHLSFLHCFWGIGTMISPVIMSGFIANGGVWQQGYESIALFQICLAAILLLSVPLWKKTGSSETVEDTEGQKSLKEVMSMRGAKAAVLSFFCYCALESTAGLWASTYMVTAKGIGINTAPTCAMLFYAGITGGRFLSGFITERAGDGRLIRYGLAVCTAGLALMLVPIPGEMTTYIGLTMAGLGCAPIFPSMVHRAPALVGESNSQTLIGIQLAAASAGSILIPPVFGLIAEYISVSLLPVFCLIASIIIIIADRKINHQ